MPGESPHKSGEKFVTYTCFFFFFDKKYGFGIRENCYEGNGAASLQTDNDKIFFDILMDQTRLNHLPDDNAEEYRIHFYCECKWRTKSSGLLEDFREFIMEKALKSVEYVNNRYTGNYYFLFVTNHFFRLKYNNVNNMQYINIILKKPVDQNLLQLLMGKMGVFVLPDWVLNVCMEGH